jgi:3-oxoacyl-[acyl-carrier protein] reductase
VPVAHTSTDRAHGRIEQRSLKVVTVSAGILFPHARQAIQITRKTRQLNSTKWTTEIAYAVTSLTAEQAATRDLATWIRSHWHIENRLHWVRDVILDEDRSQIRTSNGPRVMASLRNIVISTLRIDGVTNIAQALRHHAGDHYGPAQLLLSSSTRLLPELWVVAYIGGRTWWVRVGGLQLAALDGKTALVTGASRGLGRAIAERLAAEGARIAVHYGSNDAAAAETVARIEQTGGQAFPVRAELGVPGDIDTLFTALEEKLGGLSLDILVNNAAIAGGTLEEATQEYFDRAFAVNVRAPFFIVQRALPLLPNGGRIINISSGVTWFAAPEIVYAMTKGALDVLGRTLANLLGERGITVNTVSPGITHTDMNTWLSEPEAAAKIGGITALGRPGEPADIADAVAFFASPDARWVTGEVLNVNGGLWLGPRNPPR